MNFVLDSSLALAFVFADEGSEATDEVLDTLGKGSIAFVPALWRWEVANVLLGAERRKRIGSADVQRHLTNLAALPVEVDETASELVWTQAHGLARKHNLSSYDAAYLEIAIRRNLPLGSLDSQLRAAATAEKVPLLPRAI